jgi:hypothetical protein
MAGDRRESGNEAEPRRTGSSSARQTPEIPGKVAIEIIIASIYRESTHHIHRRSIGKLYALISCWAEN